MILISRIWLLKIAKVVIATMLTLFVQGQDLALALVAEGVFLSVLPAETEMVDVTHVVGAAENTAEDVQDLLLLDPIHNQNLQADIAATLACAADLPMDDDVLLRQRSQLVGPTNSLMITRSVRADTRPKIFVISGKRTEMHIRRHMQIPACRSRYEGTEERKTCGIFSLRSCGASIWSGYRLHPS